MKYIVSSKDLFEGLAEMVAKQVERNALPVLKAVDETQPPLEVVGTAVAKVDVDEKTLVEELMDAQARMDCDAVYQQNEWYKQELENERKRKLVYKELYEAQVEENENLKKEIIRLEAQLEYAKDNPKTTNIIQGDQINNSSTDNRLQVEKQEIKVESGGVEVQVSNLKEKENSMKDEENLYKYIMVEKVKSDTTYGLGCKPEDDQKRVDGYVRVLLNAFRKGGNNLKAFQQGEQLGYLDFENEGFTEIYNHFVELLGFAPYTYSAFYKACKNLNWSPKINVKPSTSKKFQ